MPREIRPGLTEIGGKLTPLGASDFMKRQEKIRQTILDNSPTYRDVTREILNGEYRGTSSRILDSRVSKSVRKGKKMPKATAQNLSVEVVAGKRGRKAEFDHNDFALSIGANFDVTEEMQSGIPADISDAEGFDLDAFLAEMWNMETRDESVSNFRKNRQGALKRAAVKKNGEKSRYSFGIGKEKGVPTSWIMIREKDAK